VISGIKFSSLFCWLYIQQVAAKWIIRDLYEVSSNLTASQRKHQLFHFKDILNNK